MRRYSILIQFAPDSIDDPEVAPWWASVPALPGCYTWGRSVDQVIKQAREAIELHLEGLADSGEPIPEEPVLPILHVIEVADVPAPVGA